MKKKEIRKIDSEAKQQHKIPIILSVILVTMLLMAGILIVMLPTAVAAEGVVAEAAVAESVAPAAVFPVIADFEGGVPDDWFVYGDFPTVAVEFNVATVADSDPDAIPGQVGNNDILTGTVNVPTWAGFGAALAPAQDWSDYDALSLWFYGENSGTTHEFEIQTVAGDDRRATFEDTFLGWRQIILPFSTFSGSGAYDLSQVDNWVFVLDGTVGSFKLDQIQLVNLQPFADFEGGVPADFFAYGDFPTISLDFDVVTVADNDADAVPGQVGNNDVFSATVDVSTWAGFGAAFDPVKDWSDMQGISFWFYGENSGTTHEFEIQTVQADDRRATFVDDFVGWQLIVLPFSTFGGGGAYDVSQVDNWVFVLDGTVGSFKMDDVAVYGDAGNITLKVAFAASEYNVLEGGTAMITATLNVESSETVTVTYATSDGTAVDGIDYTGITGDLVYPPNETIQTFSVETFDNNDNDDERTVNLTLSDVFNAEIGAPNPATLIIGDDETDSPSGKNVIIEDYETSEIVSGEDADGNVVGYDFFAGGSSTVAIEITDVLPAPVPGSAAGNKALQEHLFVTSGSFSGFAYKFTNATADAWVPQNWTNYAGFGFWLYGNNTGGVIFIDILDNRNPGSTTDDAERWSLDINDNFSGWQYFEFGWDEFNRKGVGNGAPNDGFNLDEVHGYAFGGFGAAPMDNDYYIDDVSLVVRVDVVDDFENGSLPSGTDPNGIPVGYITGAGGGGAIDISITDTPLAPVPGSAAGNKVLDENMTLPPNAYAFYLHAFSNETVDEWVPVDWVGYEGVCFWLYGHNTGGVLFLDVLDNRNPGSTTDDAERWSVDIPDNFDGWQFFQFTWDELNRKEIGNSAPNDGFNLTEVHGYAIGGFGSVDMGTNNYYLDNFAVWGNSGADIPLAVDFATNNYEVTEGETAELIVELNREATEPVTVTYSTAESQAIPDRDFVPAAGEVVIAAGVTTATISIETIDNAKHDGEKGVMVVLHSAVNAELGFQRQTRLSILDDELPDPTLLDDFEGFHPFQSLGDISLSVTEIMQGSPDAIPGQGAYEQVLDVTYDTAAGPAGFNRTFVEAMDWSTYNGLSFWFYGSNSGESYTVELQDNQAATTASTPANEWVMVWSDEFNDPTGTPPNPNYWTHELGDGTLNRNPGWGNGEFQYYTDDPANAATDGVGNLVMSVDKLPTDTDLVCYYGQCEYTSARLISWYKAEFEYGRIESRMKLPPSPESGLWPAFWSLGTDIGEVGWPQTGEIDIMEYVSRVPNEIFGTIHGPGYSGGASFGSPYDFGVPAANEYHTFAIEWTPDEIHWYVDGINYHNAIPANVSPNEWVFNHPFFLLFNVAIGGNFGGTISPNIVFPQETLVDYVRVYQAPNSAERFEATFTDDFSGWQQVEIPFTDFARSSVQPPNAPDDGLGLNKVWGYGFKMPMVDGTHSPTTAGAFMLDQVRLNDETTAVNLSNVDGALAYTNLQQWLLPLMLVLLIVIFFVGLYFRSKQRV